MPKFKIPSEETFGKKILIAIGLLVIVVASGTLLLSEGDFGKSFLKTIELVTHVKAEDNTFVSIILSLVGYVTQFYVLYVILEFVLEGKMRNLFTEVKTLKAISKMKNHYVICGGGRVGHHVADELKKQKKPYVMIEADELQFKKLKSKGYTVINDDVLDDKALLKAHAQDAAWLLACLGDDGDNILLVLSAKEVNPTIKIAARANHERIVDKLKHAGASQVILPEMLGGVKLAESTTVEDDDPPIDLNN